MFVFISELLLSTVQLRKGRWRRVDVSPPDASCWDLWEIDRLFSVFFHSFLCIFLFNVCVLIVWVRVKKRFISASNTWFCPHKWGWKLLWHLVKIMWSPCHKHRWKISQRLINDIQWFLCLQMLKHCLERWSVAWQPSHLKCAIKNKGKIRKGKTESGKLGVELTEFNLLLLLLWVKVSISSCDNRGAYDLVVTWAVRKGKTEKR